MSEQNKINSVIIGLFIFLGLLLSSYFLSNTAIKIKEYERTVTAKGLSEHEYEADLVIWPIEFTAADNNLAMLYKQIEDNSNAIKKFLINKGVEENEISFSSPAITDKSADRYSSSSGARFRYTAGQTVTVYSKNVENVRKVMNTLAELGKKGIVFSGEEYDTSTEYIFSRLNEVKPEMVEEATRKTREVARKFAEDSKSRLGKIKRASQGQFSISPRDKNNPHIKKVRVVSTVTYYLSD